MAEEYNSERRIFISYEVSIFSNAPALVALRMRDDFRRAGFAVCMDDPSLRPAQGSYKGSYNRVEDALKWCNVVVAVQGGSTTIGGICQAELKWAMEDSKPLLIASLSSVRPVMISELAGIPWRKYPDELHELMADIQRNLPRVDRGPRMPTVETVPRLPKTYLVRERMLAELRSLVLGERGNGVVAVTGVAGSGKSVLTAALCNDPMVRKAYPDGVAWITIGRESQKHHFTLMEEILGDLGEKFAWSSPNISSGYANVLRRLSVIVVVDDVWDPAQVKRVVIDAPTCRFVFTTRDRSIAEAVTGRIQSADLMTESEGRQLLAIGTGLAEDELPSEAAEILRACGGLPGALAQIGASVRDASAGGWGETVRSLQDVTQSGFQSVTVSLETLPAETRQRFLKLRVLLEDMVAPVVLLQTLWKCDAEEARRTASHLVERSLASRVEPNRGIRLPDLTLDYTRSRFPDQEALALIHSAMRLSAEAIAKQPEEFCSQMVGRLMPHLGSTGVREFVEELEAAAPQSWLKPLWPTMRSPPAGLICTFPGRRRGALFLNGHRMICPQTGNSLAIREVETGRLLGTLTGHENPPFQVAVSGDNRRAVSASVDGSLRVWDLEVGLSERKIDTRAERLHGVVIAPNGLRAVSWSEDFTLKVWDLETGAHLLTLVGHTAEVHRAGITPDGSRLVSGSSDKKIRVWDLETGRELLTLNATDWVSWTGALTITPDGTKVFSTARTTMTVWDLASGAQLGPVQDPTVHSIHGIAITNDGRGAVTANTDGRLDIWDLERRRKTKTIAAHCGHVGWVGVTGDARRAVSVHSDDTVRVWDMECGQEPLALPAHRHSVVSIAVTADGRNVVSASTFIEPTFQVWDRESGRRIRSIEPTRRGFSKIAVTANGRRGFITVWNSTREVWDLEIWDIERGEKQLTLAGQTKTIGAIGIDATGKRALIGYQDLTLTLLELESGESPRELRQGRPTPIALLHTLSVSPDGRRALVPDRLGTLTLWNLDEGRQVHTLTDGTNPHCPAAFLADGRHAITASKNNALQIWELATGREVGRLEGLVGNVAVLAASADGRLLVSSSQEGMRVWDLEKGVPITGFAADSLVTSCAFSGLDEIVAGDYQGRVYRLKLVAVSSSLGLVRSAT